MGKRSLPPGFRFHPTDVELVKYYLKRRVLGRKFQLDAIAEIDIYKYAPWDLPEKSYLRTGDLIWYFFCSREKKYSSGTRMNRATDLGYWKTTGKDKAIHYSNEVVGMRKTLVFHRGKAPKGERTDWVMYEYRLEDKELDVKGVAQDGYVLCSIFKKDGPGPRNGAQYGAPFKEEDWNDDDDDDDDLNGVEVVSSAGLSALLPINQNSSMVTGSNVPEGTCIASATCLTLPSASNSIAVIPDDNVTSAEPLQDANDNVDVLAMLANFSEESPFNLGGNGVDEQVDNNNLGGDVSVNPHSDGIDIYNDLGDLGNLDGFGEHEDDIFGLHNACCSFDQGDNMQFLELMDLEAPLNISAEASGYEQLQAGGSYNDSNCYFRPEEFYSVANPYNSVGLGCSQIPMLPTGSIGFEDQVTVFRKEGFLSNADLEGKDYEAELFNGNANPGETSEMGSAGASQAIRRGEQQRNTYSILQNLLESGPAYPVSAAEHSDPVNGVKGWKGIVLLSPYCGSSTHVKAEVTLQTRRCTNDALSGKLEESLHICSDWCSLTKRESEGFIGWNCLFTFVFSIGIVDLTPLNSILQLHLSNILGFCMMVLSNNEIVQVCVEAMLFACVCFACHFLSTF